jgi:hypothetical protein
MNETTENCRISTKNFLFGYLRENLIQDQRTTKMSRSIESQVFWY